MTKWLIGIDEAGRGPLAGPVAVGVALVAADFDWALLPGVNDSKQLTERKREEIYQQAKRLERAGVLITAVTLVSARQIDRFGIVPAVSKGMVRSLAKVTQSFGVGVDWNTIMVKLDGGLKAPAECVQQETIIKGDSKEKVIGLASIMAKVMRDRYMVRKAKLDAYAHYNFAQHKGYGTKLHRAAIADHGLSTEHRVSYCRNIKIR